MKPEKPITRKEMYLDVATGGSTELPSPVTREEKYLAKIAGESVDVPTPVTRYEMLLAAVAGESYTLTPVTRLEIYLAKAAGQDVEIPQPVTREEMYWFDYCGGTPTPPEREYTGAVPVTFVADGTPLIDLLISGNEEHSGTPTPDNPVMPQGTGERSAQLIPYPFYSSDGEYAGVQFTTDNGRIIANGTLTSGLLYYLWRPAKFPAGTYTMSVKGKHSGATIYFRDTTHNVSVAYIYGSQEDDRSVTFTIAEEISAMVYINAGSGSIDFDCTIMLNAGEEALPFEPTNGYKIPISSANTTTPVYLGEVETTRKIKKLVLTGEEDYVVPNISLRVPIGIYVPAIPFVPLAVISSHFQTKNSSEGTQIDSHLYTTRLGQSGGIIWFFVPRDFFSGNLNVDNCEIEFKEWLRQQYAAGTPVTVWYVLATEETAVVNEPLMRIGDYADTLSMEQAGAQIPTANGSTTLDVETTVPPSEVYIKYHGEAVATLSMLSAEVSSPEAATEEVNPEETEETENGSENISLQHKPKAIE